MKIFHHSEALDQRERSIVGARPMRMLDISPWSCTGNTRGLTTRNTWISRRPTGGSSWHFYNLREIFKDLYLNILLVIIDRYVPTYLDNI